MEDKTETNNKQDSNQNERKTNWADAFRKIKPEENNDDENINNSEDSELEKLKEENNILKEAVMRKTAEVENILKRNKEEMEKVAKFSISSFVQSLLPVIDAMYMTIDNIPEDMKNSTGKEKAFLDGVNITFNEFKKVFSANGIERIFPLDEKFNPDFHQAITQIESDKEEGTVVSVIQAGYSLNGRVIKPAMVAVSKGKSGE